MREEYIKVACLVLPTGDTLWMEEASGLDYLRKVVDKWKGEHPEFEGTPCTSGVVPITMPKSVYMGRECVCGPGHFEFPRS